MKFRLFFGDFLLFYETVEQYRTNIEESGAIFTILEDKRGITSPRRRLFNTTWTVLHDYYYNKYVRPWIIKCIYMQCNAQWPIIKIAHIHDYKGENILW